MLCEAKRGKGGKGCRFKLGGSVLDKVCEQSRILKASLRRERCVHCCSLTLAVQNRRATDRSAERGSGPIFSAYSVYHVLAGLVHLRAPATSGFWFHPCLCVTLDCCQGRFSLAALHAKPMYGRRGGLAAVKQSWPLLTSGHLPHIHTNLLICHSIGHLGPLPALVGSMPAFLPRCHQSWVVTQCSRRFHT